MQKLMQLFDLDGIKEGELVLFYETMYEVFPEVKR